MNFTREPIIETIITPRDGNKLIVRSTKGSGSEYNVDAIEVVNFGNALFFRSLERPKAFLLPIQDFEVIETKETRVAIKSAQVEKSVKIAGGKLSKESSNDDEPKEKKRRSRRRKGDDRKKIEPPPVPGDKKADEKKPVKTASLFSPPPTLISDKVQAEKEKEAPVDDSLGAGHQEEPPIEHANIEDFPSDEPIKPDPELFETSADVDENKELKLPKPTPDNE